MDLLTLNVMLEIISEMTPKQMYSNSGYIQIAAEEALSKLNNDNKMPGELSGK